MPTVTIAGYIPQDEDKLARDEEARAQRVEVLKRQEWNTFFSGVKQVFMFLSGPLIGAGLGIALPALKTIVFGADPTLLPADAEAAVSAAWGGVGLGSALLGAAAAAAGVAIGANHLGAKFAHAAAYDQFEINAQHTGKEVAKAIRQELEDMQNQRAQPVILFDNPDAQRSDGKTWARHLDERQAANQNLGKSG